MIDDHRIESYVPLLARYWDTTESKLTAHLGEIRSDRKFLDSINASIRGVADFGGKQFTDVAEMRVYRTLLYLATRVRRPEIFIETGVQNGMGTAFILLGLEHNGAGRLISVDLPPVDQRILDQGTRPLPAGKTPGWLVPDYLRARHDLRLGKAQVLLPQVLAEQGRVDIFLHDSDHDYAHLMFEVCLAWGYLKPGGSIIVDNIEQGSAFADFSRGVEAQHFIVSTFDNPQRTWQHGVVLKAGF